MTAAPSGEPCRTLLGGAELGLEGRHPVIDALVIDARDRRGVIGGRIPNLHAVLPAPGFDQTCPRMGALPESAEVRRQVLERRRVQAVVAILSGSGSLAAGLHQARLAQRGQVVGEAGLG